MNSTKKNILLYFLALLLTSHNAYCYKPRLTVVIVVDQLAYRMIEKMHTYLKGGIKELMRKGINYSNAYFPHAFPTTATGHTALNTGTFAKDHGMIANSWIENNKPVESDDDTPQNAAVFSPTGFYDYGKSAHKIMVDGLSDQFVLSSLPTNPRICVALSLKSRAAICSANKLGKAIWFDTKTGSFTSSKAYFDQLPHWLQTFNATHSLQNLQSVLWKQAKPAQTNAYQFVDNRTYSYSPHAPQSIVNTHIPIAWKKNPQAPFNEFEKTPQANKLLIDVTCACIEHYCCENRHNDLLIWLDLSSLDLVGHAYGLESKEAIDLIYHMDKQLHKFIRFAQKHAGKQGTLFVLTADHGSTPIPEITNAKGIKAQRVNAKKLVDEINEHIAHAHSVKNAVHHFESPQIYLDATLPNTKQDAVSQEIKQYLLGKEYVHKVWTQQELLHASFEPTHIENFFKQQIYPGRSGSLFVQVEPYSDITDWQTGTDHNSPYEYNTHVPLIIYQHGHLELKTISQRVWTIQLANTLADILRIPKPSASTSEILPGIHECAAPCKL